MRRDTGTRYLEAQGLQVPELLKIFDIHEAGRNATLDYSENRGREGEPWWKLVPVGPREEFRAGVRELVIHLDFYKSSTVRACSLCLSTQQPLTRGN